MWENSWEINFIRVFVAYALINNDTGMHMVGLYLYENPHCY